MIDSVAGMMNAAPTPISARLAITCVALGRQPAEQRADGEHDEAADERPLAAEAVAEGAGGEQQPGEQDGVGVDDPLELRRRGVEVLLHRRAARC